MTEGIRKALASLMGGLEKGIAAGMTRHRGLCGWVVGFVVVGAWACFLQHSPCLVFGILIRSIHKTMKEKQGGRVKHAPIDGSLGLAVS